jgi:hypothetical protein
MRRSFGFNVEVRRCAASLIVAAAAAMAAGVQAQDDSQAQPPVSKADGKTVKKARGILNSPEKWNRADNRACPNSATKFSLYCALEKATVEMTGDFAHRGAAMQEARFVIDEDLAPGNDYHHRLMNYNNDPRTTFADVQRFFDFLQARIEGRLEQEGISGGGAAAKPATVSQTDLAVIEKVEAILDSPAKWDKASTQDCKAHAKTFGLYCAFEAAALAVTGKPDYEGPAMNEARHEITRTAPNAARYSARLVDYNNDPTVTFADLQSLLKQVEANLEKRLETQATGHRE